MVRFVKVSTLQDLSYSTKASKEVSTPEKNIVFLFWRQKSTNSPYKFLWQGEEEEENGRMMHRAPIIFLEKSLRSPGWLFEKWPPPLYVYLIGKPRKSPLEFLWEKGENDQ